MGYSKRRLTIWLAVLLLLVASSTPVQALWSKLNVTALDPARFCLDGAVFGVASTSAMFDQRAYFQLENGSQMFEKWVKIPNNPMWLNGVSGEEARGQWFSKYSYIDWRFSSAAVGTNMLYQVSPHDVGFGGARMPLQNCTIHPVMYVGNGDPASCTEAAFDRALAGAKTIFFDCGDNTFRVITLNATKIIQGEKYIFGNGLVELNGNDARRVFMVRPGGKLVINGITIADGYAPDDGGGIYNGGILELRHVNFENNVAGRDGGALFTVGGSLRLIDTTFRSNIAGRNGGALANHTPQSTTLLRTFFINNAAGGSGGAIEAQNGLRIKDTVFDGNGAADGGAIMFNALSQTLTIGSTVFQNNTASQNGGAIYNLGIVDMLVGETTVFQDVQLDLDNAVLTVEGGTHFTNNSASDGAGGAIYNERGNLSITGVGFSNNVAGSTLEALGGGAIANLDGNVNILLSFFRGNFSGGSGGGAIFSMRTPAASAGQGEASITDSELFQNTAADDSSGGGIVNFNGILTLTRTTLSWNAGPVSGGGLSNIGLDGEATLLNTTFDGNYSRRGGAIYTESNLGITNSTIADNTDMWWDFGNKGTGGIYNATGSPQSITIANTLIANNGGGNCNAALTLVGGRNMQAGEKSCMPASPTIDAGLLPLDDNGGFARTRMPGPDAGDFFSEPFSCAADGGHDGLPGVPGIDQRGILRPWGPAPLFVYSCTTGAVELTDQADTYVDINGRFSYSFQPRLGDFLEFSVYIDNSRFGSNTTAIRRAKLVVELPSGVQLLKAQATTYYGADTDTICAAITSSPPVVYCDLGDIQARTYKDVNFLYQLNTVGTFETRATLYSADNNLSTSAVDQVVSTVSVISALTPPPTYDPGADPVPSSPVSPANAAPVRNYVSSPVRLSWNRTSWATAYQIQVARNRTLAAPIYADLEFANDVFFYDLVAVDGLYYWRVRAKQADGRWGNWSTTESFTVVTP